MRIIFMGTPDFAVPTLSELVGQGHEIVAVYSRPPAPAGRGMAEKRSPVHDLALRLGIPVETPGTLRSEDAMATLRAFGADVAVVVAYGLLLPQAALDVPPLGCLNLHGSLLPRWRGAAPIQRAVMAGDASSGVAVMRMEAGLDTGPVAMEARVSISPEMTAGDLHNTLAPIGADLMGRAIAALGRGTLVFQPQPRDGVTYAKKIEKGEARIDWSGSAAAVSSQIRGLSPFPGAFFEVDLGHGSERIKVLRVRVQAEGRPGAAALPGTVLDDRLTVACGAGAVQLTQVQRAGKTPLSAEDFLRGLHVAPGTILGAGAALARS